jgi:hypothetical protein
VDGIQHHWLDSVVRQKFLANFAGIRLYKLDFDQNRWNLATIARFWLWWPESGANGRISTMVIEIWQNLLDFDDSDRNLAASVVGFWCPDPKI